MTKIAAILLALLALPVLAQSAASFGFDVVSIRRDKTTTGFASILSAPDGDNITITNASPRLLIGFAYDFPLHDEIYGLPDWADSESYDVVAKVAAPDLPAFHKLLPKDRNPMLQPLLANRFHLKSHFETKTLPAYALVIAKGGCKMTEVQPAIGPDGRRNPGSIDRGRDAIIAEGAPMVLVLRVLSQQLGRPVVDRTGLIGNYSFTLRSAPVQSAALPDSRSDSDTAAPSIFTAVQEQLGLKLEPVKAPVQVLVIDHIEKPSEN